MKEMLTFWTEDERLEFQILEVNGEYFISEIDKERSTSQVYKISFNTLEEAIYLANLLVGTYGEGYTVGYGDGVNDTY